MDLKTVFDQQEVSLIDVREPLEYFMGHAKGSINIPLRKLPSSLDKIRNLPMPIVVYCLSGHRSAQAMNLLHSQGIKEVYNGGGLKEVKEHLRTAKNV